MTDHAKTTGKILCVSITIMLTVPGCSERRDSNPGPRKEKVRADAETEVTSSAGEDCGALPTIPTPEEAFAELRASSCVQYEWRRHRTDPWESFTIDSKEGRAHLARWLLEHEKKMEVCFDHRGGLSIQPSNGLLWERSNRATMGVELLYGYPRAREDGTYPPKKYMEMITNFTEEDLESLRELFKKYGRPSDR